MALCTKYSLLVVRYFPGASTDGMGLYIKPVRNMYRFNVQYLYQSSCRLCIDNLYTLIKFFSISDHTSLTFTMLHSIFCKGPPKIICYKFYNNYNKEAFIIVLKQIFFSSSNFEEFPDTFLATFLSTLYWKRTILI